MAVGHSLFWREFLRHHTGSLEVEYMKNCELLTLHV